MLGEIEHFQSVLADIIKQTISPSTLPLAGEDLVRDFRLSDHHNNYYDDQVMNKSSKAYLDKTADREMYEIKTNKFHTDDVALQSPV